MIPGYNAETKEWRGLDAEAMADILDTLWGAGAVDDDQWNEWFEEYGSPYRVPPTEAEITACREKYGDD